MTLLLLVVSCYNIILLYYIMSFKWIITILEELIGEKEGLWKEGGYEMMNDEWKKQWWVGTDLKMFLFQLFMSCPLKII